MYPIVWKAKTQNIRVWSKEKFIYQEGASQEDGRPKGVSNSLFKGEGVRGNRCVEVLGGRVIIGRLWNWAIYTKGAWTPDLLGQGLLASEMVLMFKFWLRPGPLLLCWCVLGRWGCCRRRWDFGSWGSCRSKSSPLWMLQLHSLQFWSVVSEEQLSILLNRMGPFWAGSAVIVMDSQ